MSQTSKENRGRPRTFDESEVLDACIPLFLKRGYFGVSVTELLDAIKMERSSFYLAFGDKVSFYCQVLILYHERAYAIMEASLREENDIVAAFDKIIDFFYDNCTKDDFNYGCLTANAAIEIDEKHELIGRTVRDLRGKMVSLYRQRLEQAIDDNQVSQNLDPESTAQFLKCCLDGMAVHARGHRDLESIGQIRDNIRVLVRSYAINDNSLPLWKRKDLSQI